MSSRGRPAVLADRYELGEVLGQGGMAEVRLARDRRLGRTVAVKMMRADLVDRADFVARFGKEARSVAALNHPTVVAVYDSGEAQVDGVDVVPYIVMEYVAGRTLGQLIDEGPVPVDRALKVTADVLTALEHAHAAGIVHRDIKPSNVMLTPDGAAKVMDFGIARVLSDATMTTTVVATPQYVSPEHAHGQRVDARSDLYSVGCMLFELLTGQPPFVAETSLAIVLQHLNEPPPRPSVVRPGVPPVLDRVLGRALAKERDDRYQTAAQFRDDLEAVARGEEPGGVGPDPAGLAPALVAPAVSGPGPQQPTGAGPAAEPTLTPPVVQPVGAAQAYRSISPTVQPSVAPPALGPPLAQPAPGPAGPRAVVPPDRAHGPVVGQPRRVGRWWLAGALVLVVVVAGVVWLWPRGGDDGPSQASPTEEVRDENVGDRPTQADDPRPSGQPTGGSDDQVGPGRDTGTFTADELKSRLVPPNAGSQSSQDRSLAGAVSFSGTYRSSDSVDSLAEYYQDLLGGCVGYLGFSTSEGWQVSASPGSLFVLVKITEQGSGATVDVGLTGAG